MIPNNVKQATVTGSLGDTEDFDLTVDLTALPHLMGLLTNLYSDEEMACIREYSTNAWDAHIDAGQTRAIEVTTPSAIAPFLKIKDYGVGMNKATIAKVYCKYGASTKREQVTTNGSMGIGGKAALAYSSQFTVIGIKNGIKTTVSVSRREDSTGVMRIISEEKTTEPNGTEIIIPTKASNDFVAKAEKFFQFWKPGTVLLNGVEPKNSLEKMTDRIYLYDGDDDVVVMGNVAYPIEHYKKISRAGKSVAAFVTMNGDDEVVFVPSREELNYNGITNNALMGLREEYNEALAKFIKDSISGASTYTEAFRLMRKYRNEYGATFTKDATYKGEAVLFDDIYTVDGGGNKVQARCTTYNPSRSRNAVYGGETLNMRILDEASLIITNYKAGGVSSAYKSRIKSYMAQNNIGYGYGSQVILVAGDTLPGGKWTEGFKTVSWKTVMAETKAERASSGGGFSYDGAYDVMDIKTGYYNVEHLDPKDEIVFFSRTDHYITHDIAKRINALKPGIKIVSARANRHAKLAREFPNAREFDWSYWHKQFAAEDFDKLTASDLEVAKIKTLYGNGYYSYRDDFGIDNAAAFKRVDKIDDPEYARVIRLKHSKGTDLGYAENDPRYVALANGWRKEKAIRFKDRYPLINWSSLPDATLNYVNMMYAANKKGN